MSYIPHSTESPKKNKETTTSAAKGQKLASAIISRGCRERAATSASPSLVAKVSDLDFEASVLAPYGITIQTKSLTKNLYKHFGLEGLHEDPIDRYNAYQRRLQLRVLLGPGTDRTQNILREYYSMNIYGCSEAEYSTYALCEIFRDEPRHTSLLKTADECWLPVRMLQLSLKPPLDEWEQPRPVTKPNKSYDWDISPDCMYYVSLQAFPLNFRDNVDKYVSVAQTRAFSPYLTIEFKKNGETANTIRNKVAAASALALYNRWRLKCAAFQFMHDGRWSEEHKAQMRHYSITFVGSKWELWYTTPKTYDDWSGCSMFSMHRGECSRLDSVELLLSCVNDLHYWGLMVHGRSCKADINKIAEGYIHNYS
ncbi:hypothetical protein O1611_g9007 [Lasiodiplodia mahajangana]|uniref:Uncharacterized protein n=1 Tax=Lasiodiplodia mahajangana TaxID=1108764 RepID=A0ACC2JB15_9PEZI|nr:hypothetical protein O1611_g9007 [Lasiodiplodia mahajangana]